MPRDLFSQKNEATLTASPESQTHAEDLLATDQGGYNEFTIHRQDGTPNFVNSRFGKANGKNLSDLHPYVQTLSLMDVESCVALENATFPENERCSREKVIGDRSSYSAIIQHGVVCCDPKSGCRQAYLRLSHILLINRASNVIIRLPLSEPALVMLMSCLVMVVTG